MARKSNPSAALGFLLTNLLVLPGLGSAVARKKVGYIQMALAVAGLGLSGVFLLFALRTLLKARTEMVGAAGDMHGGVFDEMYQRPEQWQRPLLFGVVGLGLFVIAWVWGLWTGLALMRDGADAGDAPPIVGSGV